jgi:hypothetical protein
MTAVDFRRCRACGKPLGGEPGAVCGRCRLASKTGERALGICSDCGCRIGALDFCPQCHMPVLEGGAPCSS